MKKQLSLLLSVAAVSLAATPAFAQSNDEQWQGPYVGVSFGIPAQSNDRGENIVFDTNLDGSYGDTVRTSTGANAFAPGFCGGAANGRTPDLGCKSDKDGFEYGGRIGYDIQNGNFVYGVVFEGGKSDARDSVSAFSSTPAFYTITREIDYQAQARARVGYATGPGLFYATGGAAYARIDNSFATSNTVNSFTNNGKSSSWGYSAGGGAEVKVMSNLSMGLEYLYTNFVDDDYVVSVGPGTASLTNAFRTANPNGTNMRRNPADSDFDSHSIRVTASLRF